MSVPLIVPPPAASLELSVVTPVYRSLAYLPTFIEETIAAVGAVGVRNWELLFVIDGSPDESLAYLLERKKDVPQITILEFSRNFGHHPAILAGLASSRGERVFLIDNDLEVRPAVMVDFWRRLVESKVDVVYAYQEERAGSAVRKSTGGLFYTLINNLSDTHIPPNILTERLMTREYVSALATVGDYNLFLGGLMYWVGFRQVGVPVEKTVKKTSTYSLLRRVELALNAITSFSSRPLTFMFQIGAGISTISFGYGAYLILRKLFLGNQVSLGYTSLATLLLFSTGLIITALGTIGIYLGKVYQQTQGRPRYIVKHVH